MQALRNTDRLYNLLPAIYRLRDEEQGSPLRALLSVIASQVGVVEADIDQLYQNWFIETCEEWVVPYIGDLLGVQPLHPVQGDEAFSLRAYVANTLRYRRRKGTSAVLEDLARDVSGWPARSVEFFQHLTTSQNLNHLRPGSGSVNLRDPDALNRLNGPFDSLSHSVDVRPAAQATGWHAIRRIGLFLWRLKSYPLSHVKARQSETHPYGYHFSPLGNPAPLFTAPQAEQSVSHLSEESNVPGPIRPLAFGLDLGRYALDNAARLPAARPPDSAFFGPNGSLDVASDGAPIPPMDVVAWDLSAWDRPPAAVEGLFSGVLSAFPSLPANPQVDLTIGGLGPFTASLGSSPSDLAGCAGALEAAIQVASAGQEFARARVLVDGNRLLLLPGRTGATIVVAASAGDAASAAALKLDAGQSTLMRGVLSADLGWLRGPADANPRVNAVIGAVGPSLVTLAARPSSPSNARGLFEAALQAANPDPAFQQARVLLLDARLLLLPGVDGARITFSAAPTDRATLQQFGLSAKVGVDVALGRLAFALGSEPADPASVTVVYQYGFSADLGGGAYDRHPAPLELRPGATTITVKKGTPTDTLAKALTLWQSGGRKPAVIEVQDNGPYEETLAIDLPVAGWLRIQAAPGLFPHLHFPADSTVTASKEGAALLLEGLLVEGGFVLSGGVRFEAHHTTLVPGGSLTEDGAPAFPGKPSLSASGTDLAAMQVLLDHCISGPLIFPAGIQSVAVQDGILLAPPDGDTIQAAVAASLDGAQPGPPLTLERVTVFGAIFVRQLDLASEVIFNDPVKAVRRQVGCVRFSYLPYNLSSVPSPFRCQPELALEQRARELKLERVSLLPVMELKRIVARLKPEFTAEQYGSPAFAQLSLNTAPEILTGGAEGSEMGAFNSLSQPQREANLKTALAEYLPFGMDIGFIFVT